MSADEPIIVCDRVCIAYDRDDVVHDVTLRIDAGAFLPFVGVNGAGKTTLLRAIVGLLTPRTGTIRTPFRRRPPGYVPQHKALDPLFPVSLRQIVEMGLYPELGPLGSVTAEQRHRVDTALRDFRLLDHQQKRFAELSGGMRQKALLARAFVSGAEVFVMDEPTAELDEASEREVLDHLHRLSADRGRTVLLAHHGLDKIDALADRVCSLNRGRAELVDLAELRRRGGARA